MLHGDLVAAARVLRGVPDARRKEALWHMLEAADVADRYRKRLGRSHALHGNGSLMAAALRLDPEPEPFLSDVDYLACLEHVVRGLIDWKARPGVTRRR